jgi:predicted RNA binding protein YcfA (HicA-like mRNA interferase family)
MSRLPGVRPRQLVAALERAGFVRHHQKVATSISGIRKSAA